MSAEVILQAIAGSRLVTNDPVRAAAFYRAIGFDVGEAARSRPGDETDRPLRRRFAHSNGARRSRVDLESFDHPGRPYPGDTTACDLVFQHLALVTDDADAAWRRARDAGATPISRKRPVTLPKSAGGATAVKFRDPEGHPLEFIQFPRGAKSGWKGTGLMGIDHTAISVGDVAASRRFYANCGLKRPIPPSIKARRRTRSTVSIASGSTSFR